MDWRVLALRKSIDEYRQDMFDLAVKKGLTSPEVIKISQKLDSEILLWQKLFI
ncbi:aspartyl-phosphate phosphatase Spo0E family protein [Peribacillus sp. R9-11]|uniref:aspartyl-phosphate phosphatase Spo0E family protein n=1 Tax=Peribacillus sp. R9-11 TaxID=3073271 RepID=UPI002868D869|nr:aspartyl-phosphate phosphatase Spo0E family protein [Peribacillus sp. R9-11]WMX58611.1 aspartyl-phosphate phosphatase Spo0E family protein [Peribacillus sp. R9-11]